MSPSTPGLQTEIDVTTDARGASQPITLIIDGDLTRARMMTPMPGGAAVAFAVTLGEGRHWVQAECRDASGDVGLSALRWSLPVRGALSEGYGSPLERLSV